MDSFRRRKNKMRRIFINPSDILGNKIKAGEEAMKHLISVLRLSVGDKFSATDGAGNEYDAEITNIEKKCFEAIILRRYSKNNTGKIINLYLSLIKISRFEYALEKASEIGANKIIPIQAQRSLNINLGSSRLTRWSSIVNQATRQSSGTVSPAIENKMTFSDAIKEASKRGLIVLADPATPLNLNDSREKLKINNEINLFIGPEGGFSPEELKYATDFGAVTFSLGDRILRTETAAAVITAILKYRL